MKTIIAISFALIAMFAIPTFAAKPNVGQASLWTGTWTYDIVFNNGKGELGKGSFDLSDSTAASYKIGLADNTTAPTAATAIPHWAGTGTTDFQSNEVSPLTGNYTAAVSADPLVGTSARPPIIVETFCQLFPQFCDEGNQ